MSDKPTILITNDDGLFAPGIRYLWEALESIAHLIVIAPHAEQSAVGLGITIRSPLKIESYDWSNGTRVWSVHGTPADCVKLGLNVISEHKPQLIVSGINRGTNAGKNLLYSGTVAGAIEGVFHDIPSIAFSCYDFDEPDYGKAVPHIPKIVDYVLKHRLASGTLLNVNFPSRAHPEIQGIKLTRQGKEFLMEDPNEHQQRLENQRYFWLGVRKQAYEEEDDCDISWLSKGYAAAVPIHVAELTDHGHLDRHRSHFEESMLSS